MANTGYVTVTERDTNPFSPTYNQTRTRTYEDHSLCPLVGEYKISYVSWKITSTRIWRRGSVDCTTGTPLVLTTSDLSRPEGLDFNLSKLVVGTCVNSIAAEAVKDRTHLEGLYISSTVTSIGNMAFAGCSNLNLITVYATTPPVLGSLVFQGSSCPIYVPEECLGVYQSAWPEYASRIRPIVE